VILVDAGPLVALVDADDRYHEQCVSTLKSLQEPADRPMDVVDAALIRIAEREGIRKIFTVDKKDFSVYRIHGRIRPSIVP
jgi:uncharacterized protein